MDKDLLRQWQMETGVQTYLAWLEETLLATRRICGKTAQAMLAETQRRERLHEALADIDTALLAGEISKGRDLILAAMTAEAVDDEENSREAAPQEEPHD